MGKDNITFHSQIWPAELLAYNGKGAEGGSRTQLGELNLPTEVVSSEFLTMEGKKFSSSKRVVIYVRDLLSRYQPDAFRYFVAAAGPESQDSDFTWAEFVRRTNDELVAGWGNLVNRTATLIAKNFGEIPPAGVLTEDDERGAGRHRAGVRRRRRPDRAATGRSRPSARRCARSREVNKYVSDTEPWKLKGDDQRERLGTVLHVVAQCVSDLNLVLSPFLPFSANAVDATFGGSGDIAPMPRIDEVDDLDGGAGLPGHHRRLHRRARVGPAADRGRHPGRQADAGLHQARRRRSSTRSWSASAGSEPDPPAPPRLAVPATGWCSRRIARDGVYRSQFETGTSNGGLTAHPGGDRWRWESRLFAGRYDAAPAADATGLRRLEPARPTRTAARSASARPTCACGPHVVERATFCFPDSFLEPDGPRRARAARRTCAPWPTRRRWRLDDLDEYVEAQVHGGVRVADDVEAVVLDPCFRDGPVHEAADRLGCAVEWHPGFRVATAGPRRRPTAAPSRRPGARAGRRAGAGDGRRRPPGRRPRPADGQAGLAPAGPLRPRVPVVAGSG